MAALRRLGARKASEIVILTWRSNVLTVAG
jgi:hypothetical protein